MHDHQADAHYITDLKEAESPMVCAFEQIAVSVAVTTHCSYCIEDHAKVPSPPEPPRPMLQKPLLSPPHCAPAQE
ncbi:hypothetical protein [Arthrobacter sp. HS15c]|uniref:hypothetical protein n=1 Tax=Arthrobacter sp. HS15c TaxID=3230279 RepID=UPI003465A6F2